MQPTTNSRAALEAALARHGLRVRGGWIPTDADDLPVLPRGRRPAVVWMVGQAGSECWSAFAASAFAQDGQPDPMDRWSKAIGDALAHQCAGVALYPSDGPPWYPFQRWAQRAEALQTSPLMLQIHPQFGLWHAYRFALLAPALLPHDRPALTAPRPAATDLCLRCDGQPCLGACPVHAFSAGAYDGGSCAAFLHRPEGQDCMRSGCQARRACPVGTDFAYAPEHAAFHMAAFARRH